MEEWNSTYPGINPKAQVNPGQGLPNADEQIRLILWQQSMTELINDQTRVLIEIRDILREEQVVVEDMFGESEYTGKHRRGDGQIQDKEVR